MQQENKPKWCYTVWGIIILILLIGPVAFIFLWKSKQFNMLSKILVTIIVTILTIWMIVVSLDVLQATLKELKSIGF